MKTIKIHALLIILFVTINSCKKDDFFNLNKLYGTWETVSFFSVESIAYSKNNDYNPIIEFKENGEYGLMLDVNGCSGNYYISGKNIEFDPLLCTEICCDSDFSEKLVSLIHDVSSYTIKKNQLQLNIPGWGYIKLKKK